MTGSSRVHRFRMKTPAMKLASTFALALFAAAAPAIALRAPADATPANPLEDCSAHKFETIVERVVDGEPRKSRVRLCGQKGQSEADWIGTLEDAIAKLRANEEMPAATRNQVIAAIEREIGRLRDPESATAAAAPPTLTPRATKPRDLRDDYASLPALPPPVTTAPAPPLPENSATPSASSATPVVARAVATAPLLVAPSLELVCYVPGDMAGPAPCIDFQRDTVLTVRAKTEVAVGTELHFERNGVDRASIAIGPLKSGRTKRIPLPSGVCQGVGDGRLTIATWMGSRPARTEGPFPLRCT